MNSDCVFGNTLKRCIQNDKEPAEQKETEQTLKMKKNHQNKQRIGRRTRRTKRNCEKEACPTEQTEDEKKTCDDVNSDCVFAFLASRLRKTASIIAGVLKKFIN